MSKKKKEDQQQAKDKQPEVEGWASHYQVWHYFRGGAQATATLCNRYRPHYPKVYHKEAQGSRVCIRCRSLRNFEAAMQGNLVAQPVPVEVASA